MNVIGTLKRGCKVTGMFLKANKGAILHYGGQAMIIAGGVMCVNAGRHIDPILKEYNSKIAEIRNGKDIKELTKEEKAACRKEIIRAMKKMIRKFGPGVAVFATGMAANEAGHIVMKKNLTLMAAAYAELWKTYNDYKETVESKLTPEQVQEINVETIKKSKPNLDPAHLDLSTVPIGAGPLSFWIDADHCPNLRGKTHFWLVQYLQERERNANNMLRMLPKGAFMPAIDVLRSVDHEFRDIPAGALIDGWYNDGKTVIDFHIQECMDYRVLEREESPQAVNEDPAILIDLNANAFAFNHICADINPYDDDFQKPIDDPDFKEKFLNGTL